MARTLDHTLSGRLQHRVETIVGKVGPEQIVRFGSRSKTTSSFLFTPQGRVDAQEASDVGLAIPCITIPARGVAQIGIVEEWLRNGRERVERITQVWRALSDVWSPKDRLVYSRDEVE